MTDDHRQKAIEVLNPSRIEGRHIGTAWAGLVLHEKQAAAIVDALIAAGFVRETDNTGNDELIKEAREHAANLMPGQPVIDLICRLASALEVSPSADAEGEPTDEAALLAQSLIESGLHDNLASRFPGGQSWQLLTLARAVAARSSGVADTTPRSDYSETEKAVHRGIVQSGEMMTIANALMTQDHYNEFLHSIASAVEGVADTVKESDDR